MQKMHTYINRDYVFRYNNSFEIILTSFLLLNPFIYLEAYLFKLLFNYLTFFYYSLIFHKIDCHYFSLFLLYSITFPLYLQIEDS